MNKYSIKMNISKNTRKIIEFLLRNIDRIGFNSNQLAKNLKISVGSAHLILQRLKKEDILKITDLKNSIYYRLNLSNSDTIDICKIIIRENKKILLPYIKIYSEEIEKFEKAEIIILFGSILNKKDFNDVDVLFVANKIEEVNKFCSDTSKIRTKPINPLIMKFEDFIGNIKNNNNIIVEIIKKGIIIKGEERYMEALKNAD